MKHFKFFKLHSEYETYINSEYKLLPNLSYCEDVDDVHFNPWVAPSRVLTAVYNIPTTANPISLYLDEFPNEIESVLVTRPNGTTFELSSSDLVEYDSITNYGDPYMAYQFDMTGEHTFEYTFKPNVTTFTYNLFFDIPYVISVDIPNCITTIFGIDAVYSAFGSCTGLTSITIPNSVTEICEDAFANCTGLTSINIPNSVTTIGEGAFRQCSGLTSVTIPNSVTSIGNNAFNGCSGLISIVVNSGNSVYDSRNNCNAIIETASNTLIQGLSNTIIPNSVTTIGGYAFSNCSGLTSITIPNSVTTIGVAAFFYCSSLTNITIPNSVTTIGGGAFQNTGFTSITIPNSVTSIGQYAFYNCNSLTSVTVEATTPPTLGGNAFINNASGRKIYVPSASVAAYKAASGWSDYASSIEAIS